LATITFQNFFNKYKKKAGMTGTALTEENEFREIYGMDVVEVPTNLPVARIDENDSIFCTKQEKLNAIVEDINECYRKGQPVLVGTITIDSSEEVSRLLTKKHIPHKVLNAKFHEMEAEIVAQAGQMNAVTIATNMAGRGTDIKLGEGVKELGGLRIIGTERHESRRIDNQLRGRSGRQGDPGQSKFYLSLEDDLMRLFGSERVMAMYQSLNIPEGEEIQHKTITSFIEKAQKKIENNNFGIRKNLLDYDQVNNEQREVIYKERRRVLDGENMRDVIFNMINETVEEIVNRNISEDLEPVEWDMKALNQELADVFPIEKVELSEEDMSKIQKQDLIQCIKESCTKLYEEKETEFPEPEMIREAERVILLKVIDRKWMDHIDDMDQMRQSIGLRAYGQRDPLVEYKFAGYDMFNDMTASIRQDTVKAMMHLRVEQKVEREEVAKVTGTNKDDTSVKAPVRRKSAKIGRNDPCPCGSGLKYKQCCGKNA
jgi:preprotein translocase subunit SecA